MLLLHLRRVGRKYGKLDTGMIDAKALYAAIFREYTRKQDQQRAKIIAFQRSSQSNLDVQQLGDIKASVEQQQQQFQGVDWGFTDLDAESAMEKLAEAALRNEASVVRADCFTPAQLPLPAFRRILRQVLSMQLNKREFAALVR